MEQSGFQENQEPPFHEHSDNLVQLEGEEGQYQDHEVRRIAM